MRERDGHRVSRVLTEARTVHSRAQTALLMINWQRADPAYAEVKALLEEIVQMLDPFKKVGKTKEVTK